MPSDAWLYLPEHTWFTLCERNSEAARSIILEGKGEHFDPDIVDAFVETEEQFLAVKENFNSPKANLLAPQQFCHA